MHWAKHIPLTLPWKACWFIQHISFDHCLGFFEKCLVLVLSSGTELHGGGWTSLMPRSGPGKILLLLHPAQTGIFILVDLGYLCGESRIWKHWAEAHPFGASPFNVRTSEPQTGQYWPASASPHTLEEIVASYAVLSEDTEPAQIKRCSSALLGARTTLNVQQESDFQSLGDFHALSSQHKLFLLGW